MNEVEWTLGIFTFTPFPQNGHEEIGCVMEKNEKINN